ncbi:MAG: hypothetical protein [Malazfec virus 4]
MEKINELLDQTGNEAIEHNELFSVTPINGSPFNILTRDGKHSLVFGKFALTEPMESAEEVHGFLRMNYWNIICTLATIISDDVCNHILNSKKSTQQ